MSGGWGRGGPTGLCPQPRFCGDSRHSASASCLHPKEGSWGAAGEGPCAQETEGAAGPQTQVNSQRNGRCQPAQEPNTFTQLTFPGVSHKKIFIHFCHQRPLEPQSQQVGLERYPSVGLQGLQGHVVFLHRAVLAGLGGQSRAGDGTCKGMKTTVAWSSGCVPQEAGASEQEEATAMAPLLPVDSRRVPGNASPHHVPIRGLLPGAESACR